jgi:solute carrier family 13 (sodium-dependent dicarboxylate transporter), member 2/3/5
MAPVAAYGLPSAMADGDQDKPYPRSRLAGLVLGPLAAAAMLAGLPPEGLSADGWRVAAVGVCMALWWMTEALPLAATALLPLVLFPLLGARTLEATAPAYAHPLILLFLGGFLMAAALHGCGLDRRLALSVLRLAGTGPRAIIAALMAVTAFLSMWVSNTATAMVMLPIGLSIVAGLQRQAHPQAGEIAPALLLGIAYAATIGGMGTIIGTPPNALFVAYMADTHGIEVTFLGWMLVGVPVMLALLPLTFLVLTRVAFRVPGASAPLAAPAGDGAALPPPSRAELMTGAVLLLVGAAWVFRPLLEAALPGLPLSDAWIGIAGALLMFLLPVDLRRGRFLLSWRQAAEIRWDVLILFGGGLALADAIGATDLAAWLGSVLAGLDVLPAVVLLLVVGALMVGVGELASNTAMAAVFLPVAGAVAAGMGEPVVALTLPIALYASLGFMLPVATPPNAVIFASGAIEMRHMLRAGAILDVLGILVVTVAVLALGDWVLG